MMDDDPDDYERQKQEAKEALLDLIQSVGRTGHDEWARLRQKPSKWGVDSVVFKVYSRQNEPYRLVHYYTFDKIEIRDAVCEYLGIRYEHLPDSVEMPTPLGDRLVGYYFKALFGIVVIAVFIGWIRGFR